MGLKAKIARWRRKGRALKRAAVYIEDIIDKLPLLEAELDKLEQTQVILEVRGDLRMIKGEIDRYRSY